MTGQMRVGAAPLFLATPLLSPQALLLLSHCSQQPSKVSVLETYLWAMGFWNR